MAEKLQDFYHNRKGEYQKDSAEENYLLHMNEALQAIEKEWYKDVPIEHPFIFVFGLPRSGTTLLTQFIAHSFDVSYINNLMARFWLAPLHGIRLSNSILSDKKTNFVSDYARTADISDIHEFGYFWRYWLKKDDLNGVTDFMNTEKNINWVMLKRVLSNIQSEFNKPMVFKNIFGSYHIKKLIELLEKVVFIYIERDELDVAVSILNARKKYYNNLNTWWSYMPPEFNKIKDLDFMEQIAGQIYYLKKFYYTQIKCNSPAILTLSYQELCKNPIQVAKKIENHIADNYDYSMKLEKNIPTSFPFRTYSKESELKEDFKRKIHIFENE